RQRSGRRPKTYAASFDSLVGLATSPPIVELSGVRTETCAPGMKTGDQISPPGGYVGGGLQMQTDIAVESGRQCLVTKLIWLAVLVVFGAVTAVGTEASAQQRSGVRVEGQVQAGGGPLAQTRAFKRVAAAHGGRTIGRMLTSCMRCLSQLRQAQHIAVGIAEPS